MAGVANRVGEWKIFKSTTFSGGADWAMTRPKISSSCARRAIKKRISNSSSVFSPNVRDVDDLPQL
jgi:hypothetical protein